MSFMFGALTSTFQNLFSKLGSAKTLTEENIGEALREVRLALLDADVNYGVVSHFVKKVKEKALGAITLKGVKPKEQFIQIVHEELTSLMGSSAEALDLNGKLSVVMLFGLQGSGKTTTAAKLAAYIQRAQKQKKVLLAACDLERPAAILQLKKLGSEIGVPVFSLEGNKSPIQVAVDAKAFAIKEGFDVLIVDTAGRQVIDASLMEELKEMKKLLEPRESLFVASAMTGQAAVKVASEFEEKIGITGSILTMLDGSARAGAAVSIREVTKKALKFEGVGERIDDFQLFHPRSMADRILGMGDVINLVEKTKHHFDEKESEELEKKLLKSSFTYEDYLKQMGMVRKMGSLKSLLKMIPGVGSALENIEIPEKEFGKMEAMIFSMTPKERLEREDLSHSRRARIAKGSGVSIDEVNRLVKGFKRAKQLFKNLPEGGLKKQRNQKWH